MIFFFKLLVTPLFVAFVAYVQKRWNHTVGGAVSGLPFFSAPISVFLAIEQGLPFARSAGASTLAALLGVSAYVMIYMTLAKSRPWYMCWLGGVAGCLAVFYMESLLDTPPAVKVALGILAMIINTLFIARMPLKKSAAAKGTKWDLPIRAVAALIPLLLITGLAHLIGPKYSGMFSSFPVFWTVLFISTQIQWGYDALVNFLRGAVLGNYGMPIFFSIIIFAPINNIAVLYLLATFVTALSAAFINRHKGFLMKKPF